MREGECGYAFYFTYLQFRGYNSPVIKEVKAKKTPMKKKRRKKKTMKIQ